MRPDNNDFHHQILIKRGPTEMKTKKPIYGKSILETPIKVKTGRNKTEMLSPIQMQNELNARRSKPHPTPRPWELNGFEICNEIQNGLVQAVPIYTNRIAGTLSPVSDDWDTAQANARLIVKAVNAYEDHLDIIRQVVAVLEQQYDPQLTRDWDVYDQMKQALAQATEGE